MTGFTGAARCDELLTTRAGITGCRGFGKLSRSGSKVSEFALKVVHVGPDIRFGPGGAFVSAGCEASFNAKLCSMIEVIRPGRKPVVIPLDLAFDHVAHRGKRHAQQREGDCDELADARDGAEVAICAGMGREVVILLQACLLGGSGATCCSVEASASCLGRGSGPAGDQPIP